MAGNEAETRQYGVKWSMQKMPAALRFVQPMECAEVKTVRDIPRGKQWQYEIKLDGYRAIAVKQHNEVEIFSRRGNTFTQFANLVDPLRGLRAKAFIIDGEIVALDEQGKPAFQRLQQSRGRKQILVHFYAFDLLHVDGDNLMDQPLARRQAELQRIIPANNEFVRLSPPLKGDLKKLITKIQQFGFEGVVAKREDSIYVPGKAPGSWVKKKLKPSAEFIVGGYIGDGSVDSLVVGRYGKKGLMFVENVRAGFVPATRRQVHDVVKKLRADSCPFVNLPEKGGAYPMDREKMAEVTWIKPRLVAEIAFNEWTPAKHLRHGEFVRLRSEKSVEEVGSYPD